MKKMAYGKAKAAPTRGKKLPFTLNAKGVTAGKKVKG